MNAFRVLPALMLLTLAFAAAAPAGAQEGRCAAWFESANAGGVQLDTQLANGTFVIPARQVGMAFGASTTGTMNVDIGRACVEKYRLVVEHVSGTGSGVVYDTTVAPGCGSGTDTHAVPIGLNAGSYRMTLTWGGCDGSAGEGVREWIVCDPPLPLPWL